MELLSKHQQQGKPGVRGTLQEPSRCRPSYLRSDRGRLSGCLPVGQGGEICRYGRCEGRAESPCGAIDACPGGNRGRRRRHATHLENGAYRADPGRWAVRDRLDLTATNAPRSLSPEQVEARLGCLPGRIIPGLGKPVGQSWRSALISSAPQRFLRENTPLHNPDRLLPGDLPGTVSPRCRVELFSGAAPPEQT